MKKIKLSMFQPMRKSKKFCNILVHVGLWYIYPMTKAVQAMEGTHCGWYYLPTPPLWQDMTQGQFFKRSLTGLNSEFSFS